MVAGALALTAWVGASIAWSIVGDASWGWLNRGLVYLAALVLGGLVAQRLLELAAVLAGVLGVALGWAVLGVMVPAWFEDGDRIARLREPVGYWNALALLADAAIVLGLGSRCDRVHSSARWVADLFSSPCWSCC